MKNRSAGSLQYLRDRYLDLLKKTLTNTLHATEPDHDSDSLGFVIQFSEHYIDGSALSMLPLVRFDNIRNCIEQIVHDQIPGDLIETGVWRGGATIFMRAVLDAYDVRDRKVWVADSFEGLPEPDPLRFPKEAKAHGGNVMRGKYRHFAVSKQEVQSNFEAFGLLDRQVEFVSGWFKDSLPRAPIDSLSLMRLDGDYYDSTMDALVHLYDKLAVGGYVIVDDYGEVLWTHCREAVDTFREARGICDPIVQVDSKCCYWRKGA